MKKCVLEHQVFDTYNNLACRSL